MNRAWLNTSPRRSSQCGLCCQLAAEIAQTMKDGRQLQLLASPCIPEISILVGADRQFASIHAVLAGTA
jgi:hypothetical protein